MKLETSSLPSLVASAVLFLLLRALISDRADEIRPQFGTPAIEGTHA